MPTGALAPFSEDMGPALIWELIPGSAVRAGGGRQGEEETSKERGGER